MTSRITGYGVGAAKVALAPVPAKSNGVPTSSTAYDFGQLIYNSATGTWYAYSGGTTYVPLGGGTTSGILSINGIFPAVGGDFTLAAGTGVTLTPGTNTITIGLTGGGVAIDSFTPDAGTNPVVPSAAGLVTMAGTANQITTTGGLNSLTFSVPSTFIAPGSIAATTSLTATLGNITATNGNLVLTAAGNKMVRSSVGTTSAAGANSIGSVTLVGGTVTVATTAVTTNSLIQIWRQSIGATGAAALGMLSVGTITNGTSFVINALQAADATALQASDVSVIGWEIIN